MSLSASSTRRHAASLLPKHLHNPQLLELIKGPLTSEMATHIAAKCVEVIDCRPDPALASPPTTPVRSTFGSAPAKLVDPSDPVPALAAFITLVSDKSHCHLPTLLVTLVYLERLKTRLPKTAKGTHSTRHRVFLATLIVAAKYCNDSSPMNAHWVRYAGATFNQAEVNLMERQLLAILDWDLDIQEAELVEHLQPFFAPAPAPAPARSSLYLNRAAAQANLRDITPTASRPSYHSHSRQSSTETGETGRSLTSSRPVPPPVPSRSAARPSANSSGPRHHASSASFSSTASSSRDPGATYSASSSDDELASPEPASSPDAPVHIRPHAHAQLAGSYSCSHLSPPPSPTRGLRKMLSRANLGQGQGQGQQVGVVKSASYAGLSQSQDGPRKPTALKRMFNRRERERETTAPATLAGAHHWA